MTTNQLTITTWLDALRSGDYKQARRELRAVDNFQKTSYCCLGIACDLFDPKIWAPDAFPFSLLHHNVENLPPKVQLHLHIRHPEGVFKVTNDWLNTLDNNLANKIKKHAHEHYVSLATLNDNGFTFEEIADIIESNPPGLFDEGFYS